MRDVIWSKLSTSAPDAYTIAIEAKLVAEQQKIQANFERQIVIIEANATADEIRIEAASNA